MYQGQYMTRICISCRGRIEEMENPIAVKISVGNAAPWRRLTEEQMADLLREMPRVIAAALAEMPNPTFHLCLHCWDRFVVTEDELAQVVAAVGEEVRSAMGMTVHPSPEAPGTDA